MMEVMAFRYNIILTDRTIFISDVYTSKVTLKEHDPSSRKADFDIVFRLFPVIEVQLDVSASLNP